MAAVVQGLCGIVVGHLQGQHHAVHSPSRAVFSFLVSARCAARLRGEGVLPACSRGACGGLSHGGDPRSSLRDLGVQMLFMGSLALP